MIEVLFIFALMTTDVTWTIALATTYGLSIGLKIHEITFIFFFGIWASTIIAYYFSELILKKLKFRLKEIENIKKYLGKKGTFFGMIFASYMTWCWLTAVGASLMKIKLSDLLVAISISGAVFYAMVLAIVFGVSTYIPDLLSRVFVSVILCTIISIIIVEIIKKREAFGK